MRQYSVHSFNHIFEKLKEFKDQDRIEEVILRMVELNYRNCSGVDLVVDELD